MPDLRRRSRLSWPRPSLTGNLRNDCGRDTDGIEPNALIVSPHALSSYTYFEATDAMLKLLFLVALIGLFVSSGVHLAVANGLPIPEEVFVLHVGVLILILPLAGSVRRPSQSAPRLNYWWNAWREAPLQLQLLTVLLGGYLTVETWAWIVGSGGSREGSFLRVISSAWMCAYAVEAAFLSAAATPRR